MSYSKEDVVVKRLMLNELCGRESIRNNHHALCAVWLKDNIPTESARDKQVHIYTNMIPQDEAFYSSFRDLFKPIQLLQNLISYHSESIGDVPYISISFRFTSLLGDFKDVSNEILEDSKKEKLIKKCLSAITDIRKENPGYSKVLITADSSRFLEEAKRLAFVYVIEGTPGHIDFCQNDDVVRKMFLDFCLIGKADLVYQVVTGKMYGGRFSYYAAIAHGKKHFILSV